MKDGNDNACTHAPTVDSDKDWWAFIRGVTSGLQDVENNDLDLLGLIYCTSLES